MTCMSQGNIPKPTRSSSKKNAPKGPAHELSDLMADIASGIKILEDRYSNLRKKTQLTDQSLLDAQREFEKERKILNEELMELKIQVNDMQSKLKTMNDELGSVAKEKDLRVLEKYLDLWQPIRFITRKEAEKILEDELKRRDS